MYDKVDLPIVEARLDWITATAHLDYHPDVLRHHGELRVGDYERQGYDVKPWRFQGYYGIQCGPWRVGYGKNGTIAVVSGQEAEDEALVLARYSSHWSRVDYCTTVWDPTLRVNPALDYWQAWPPVDLPPNRHKALTRIQSYLGGQSISLGSRASAHFLRVYDKTAESKEAYPQRCWRFEIEMKRHASEGEHLRWRAGWPPLNHSANLIAQHMSKYRLNVPWNEKQPVRQAVEIKKVPDLERTLEWLRNQVRPSVQWAAQLLGENPVLEALGLPRVAYEENLQ